MIADESQFSDVRKTSNLTFSIVAIGAAAGGVEAVKELLQYLNFNSGLAYVYIQHPDAAIEFPLKPLISKLTEMPVQYAEEGMAVAANHFYILPLDQSLAITDYTFRKVKKGENLFDGLPINRFFTSLAENYKERAIGILLSGSITDGVAGMKAIKIGGGLTFVQNHTAEFQSMPTLAIKEGAADLILSPKELAKELEKTGREKDIFYKAINELNEDLIDDNDDNLRTLFKYIHHTTGVDFTLYKFNTIKRRIIRRMMLYKIKTLDEYVKYLDQNTNEINFLYQDFLINVTSFFRDEDTTNYLVEELLPKIINTKSNKNPLRIWVPDCSTGQEAYSLAMLVLEALGENATNIQVQIFATDLSEAAINKARMGVYTKDEMIGVSPKRLQRFFTKPDGHFRILKSIRDLCVFAHHNIVKDPPFSRLDIISCCNLMIYLDTPLQKKLLSTFHHSLNNTGYLILGKSETVGTSSYLFTLLDKKVRVYSKKKDAIPQAQFDLTYRTPDFGKLTTGPTKSVENRKAKSDEAELDRVVDTLLLKKFTPASVVVNYDLDILLFRGSTGLYLEPAPGKASLNLMKMAKPGLGFELRNIVHKAKKSGEPAQKEGIDVRIGEQSKRVTIQAIPLKTESLEDYYLVVFDEARAVKNDKDQGKDKNVHVKQLEEELTALREDMRSIVDAQETANEELQSANEEIVSSNEELQSINEELETSKEEVESSNEELITINQELQLRNEQLAEAQEYSQAIFSFMNESLIILDKGLRVKTANRSFYKTFQVMEEDTQGRLIYDLGNRQWNLHELRALLQDVIEKNSVITQFEVSHIFPGIGEKIMLINARKIVQKQLGEHLILLAIEDITQHRQAQKIVAEREAWFKNMADNAPVMIWLTGNDRLCKFVNKTFLDFRNITPEDVIGKSWIEGVREDDVERCQEIYNSAFDQRKPFEFTYHLQYKDGNYRQIITKAKPNYTTEGEFTGYIGSCLDLDEHLKKK